jgi:hypothetical protein
LLAPSPLRGDGGLAVRLGALVVALVAAGLGPGPGCGGGGGGGAGGGDAAPDATADAAPDTAADAGADGADLAREPGPAPELRSISPARGPLAGGQQVTGQGRHFQTPTQVFFGDAEAPTVLVVDEQSLSILVPPASVAGTVDVRVVTRDGQDVLANGYTYVAQGQTFVESLSPARGDIAGGDTVTVTGQNLPTAGFVEVVFGSTPAAEIHLDSDTAFTVVTPPHDYGSVAATFNLGGDVQVLPDAFLFWSDLRLDSVAPPNGPAAGGSNVDLFGAGFVDGAGIQVFFGDTLADPAQYLFDGTTMGVVSPAGVAGAVDVRVTGDNGTSTLTGAFTYE